MAAAAGGITLFVADGRAIYVLVVRLLSPLIVFFLEISNKKDSSEQTFFGFETSGVILLVPALGQALVHSTPGHRKLHNLVLKRDPLALETAPKGGDTSPWGY